MWKHILLSVILSFILNVGTAESAIYTDNFDTYTVGDIAGQGIWAYYTGGGTAGGSVATSTFYQSASRSLAFAIGQRNVVAVGLKPAGDYEVSYDLYISSTTASYTSGMQMPNIGYASATSSINANDFVLCGSSDRRLNDRNGGTQCSSGYFTSPLDFDTWHNVRIQGDYDGVGYTTTVVLDDQIQYTRYATTTLGFGLASRGYAGGSTLGKVYVDDLVYYTEGDVPPLPPDDETTRIISFEPLDGQTVSSPVTFDLLAYVNEADIGTVTTIQITFQNIDQNVLLLGFLSPGQFTMVDENITEAGYFSYATTSVLADGNYRVEACIKRTFLGGLLGDFFTDDLFSGITDCQSHQFVVGTSTFIGSLTQTIWGDTNTFLEGLTATSSEALASTCNPLSGNFDVRQCFAYLTVPDAYSLSQTVNSARESILTRWPWGYGTRFVQILTSSPTSTLPSVSVPILYGSGYNEVSELDSFTLTFDFGDMVAGGGALLDQVSDPVYGKNVRDVFEPFVILFIAGLVVLIIVNDLMTVGRDRHSSDKNSKLH